MRVRDLPMSFWARPIASALRSLALATIAAGCLAGCAPAAPAHKPPEADEFAVVGALAGTDWVEYRVTTSAGPVRVYSWHDDAPKPVVVLLQGSACYPLFTVDPDGRYHGTTVFEDVMASHETRVHFAMIEKRGVEPLRFPAGSTHAQQLAMFQRIGDGECSAEFYQQNSKGVRVADVLAAVQALARQPWVTRVIVGGHSEGTRVAAGVVKADSARTVEAVGLFSSATIQGVDGDPSDREAFAAAFSRQSRIVDAPDDEMIDGLPARRWKSYTIDATPLDDLRDSTTPLFVAHGGREPDLRRADAFVLEVSRLRPRHPLRYVVVQDGDHAFARPAGESRMPELFADFLNWALDPRPEAGIVVLP